MIHDENDENADDENDENADDDDDDDDDDADKWRSFALDLNAIWPALYRTTGPDVWDNPQRYSLLRREAGLVLPGGRFRESYYWDSYWIVRGLLACGMAATAEGVASNLLQDVADFGFVPNGGRVYYSHRTQPPLLALMVADVARAPALLLSSSDSSSSDSDSPDSDSTDSNIDKS